MVHDEEVGYGDWDEQVSTAETSEEEKSETDKVYEYFLKLAGEDKEVDWLELKEILDYSMKEELAKTNQAPPHSKQNINNLNTTPSANQTQTADHSFLTNLLGLICGTFCKDSPLAEIIPQPVQNSPDFATYAGLSKNSGFSKDICRSMVAMLDVDKSGKLGYEEFQNLWVLLRNWKNVWSIYDVDSSGSLSGFELRQAMHSAGYKLNSRILNVLMHRYGNKVGEIAFDDFLLCAVKVKTMMDVFKAKDLTQINSATFTFEEWLENTLYS